MFTERAVYPGHAITLAVQIAQTFPDLEAALAKSQYSDYSAAKTSDKVDGAGSSVSSAIQLLIRLRRGETLETALEWADSLSEYPYRDDWPAACEQARRALATIDLVAWARPATVMMTTEDIAAIKARSEFVATPADVAALIAYVEALEEEVATLRGKVERLDEIVTGL